MRVLFSIKLNDFSKAVQAATEAIDNYNKTRVSEYDVATGYRVCKLYIVIGKCYINIQKYNMAIESLNKAYELVPKVFADDSKIFLLTNNDIKQLIQIAKNNLHDA